MAHDDQWDIINTGVHQAINHDLVKHLLFPILFENHTCQLEQHLYNGGQH